MEEIYKSRKIIIEMLKIRNYDVSSWSNFSKDEIEIMKDTNLNFKVFSNMDAEKSIEIIYLLDKQKNPNQQKFEISILHDLLDKSDNNNSYIFILPENDNDNALQDICNKFYDIYGIYVQVFFIKNLCYNILDHKHVPYHKYLDNEESEFILNENKIKRNNLPKILRNDPVAKFLGLKKNDIVQITRPSISGGKYKSFRVCI